ncbi:hypothetical protein BX666DRAFT_2026537 [Dichotomocladium elegans]|nr:hypothetical protein BX666DRAFT_2026537 [Dichotomocladium elegans]
MNPYPILSDPYHDTTQAALASIHGHPIEQSLLHNISQQQQQQQPLHHHPQPITQPQPQPQSAIQTSPLSQPSYDIIQDLQHQLDDSRQLQDQYQIRIQRLMELVEKQTSIIADLRRQLLNKQQQPHDNLVPAEQLSQQPQ